MIGRDYRDAAILSILGTFTYILTDNVWITLVVILVEIAIYSALYDRIYKE